MRGMSERLLDQSAAPRRFRRIIDRVKDRDQQYFEHHPDQDVRYRAYVPGEFWPRQLTQDTYVEVRQLAPGRRERRPYVILPVEDSA